MIEEIGKYKYIYHYTSFDALFAILHNYRIEEKDCFVFRASSIYNVNDPMEMISGYNAIKKFIQEYEEEKKIPHHLRLTEVFENKEYEEICKSDYLAGKNGRLTIGHVPYVISFSARRDYLPMWNLYGKNGMGVCLKFDIPRIINNKSQELNFIGFVKYVGKGKTRLHSGDIKKVLDFSYKSYLSSCYCKRESLNIKEKISELATNMLCLSPFIKYKDYSYEKEFRIVVLKQYGIQENIDVWNMLLLPYQQTEKYIEYNISKQALREIIIGPCANYDVMKHIISNELKGCDLQVEISKSRIPFRIK